MKEEFSIQFVSKVTGINAHTIRAWEKRYQVVVPNRDDKGRRLYSQGHIERLNMLRELVDMGNKISDLSKLQTTQLKNLCDEYGGQANSRQTRTSENIDLNSTLQNLVMALSAYKIDIISHELEKMKASLSPRDFALNIVLPLLNEVGQRVDAGYLGIAQEHALSSLLKFHIGGVLYQSTKQSQSKFNIAIAAPEGERHEFGILIAALLCSHYGLNFFYLGADLPLKSIVDAVTQLKSDVLLMGVSGSYVASKPTAVDEAIDTLVLGIPKETELWFGGIPQVGREVDFNNLKCIPTIQALDVSLSKL